MQTPDGQPPQGNPVIDAFKTLMQFVGALEQKGSPAAAKAKEQLQTLMQTVVQGAQGGGSEAQPGRDGAEPKAPEGQPPADGEGEAAPEGAAEPKLGFDPFKDASEDEQPTDGEEEPMPIKKKSKRPPIQPLV